MPIQSFRDLRNEYGSVIAYSVAVVSVLALAVVPALVLGVFLLSLKFALWSFSLLT